MSTRVQDVLWLLAFCLVVVLVWVHFPPHG
jgi:hypothetical protein